MKSKQEIKKIALATIASEIDAMQGMRDRINDDFVEAVQLIFQSSGRVVITGIGKSALVAGKIVATLNSTGTPSIFMHAADAIHGDMGIIQPDDVVICLSKSGETAEIKVLVPLIRQLGNKLVAIVGNMGSFLARNADLALDTTVPKEACPNNLAPTSSTTAQMVMGDALAVALLECRGFTSGDFARFHPGGSLGKKLYLRVEDLYTQNELPQVEVGDDIRTVIVEITSKRLGATAVLKNGELVGIITDGDLRRMLQKFEKLEKISAEDIMTRNPRTVTPETFVVDALDVMRSNNITQLPVLKEGKYLGVIHLHDVLKEGII